MIRPLSINSQPFKPHAAASSLKATVFYGSVVSTPSTLPQSTSPTGLSFFKTLGKHFSPLLLLFGLGAFLPSCASSPPPSSPSPISDQQHEQQYQRYQQEQKNNGQPQAPGYQRK